MKELLRQKRPVDQKAQVILLLLAATILVVYFLMRYGGRWGDNDSQTFTAALAAIVSSARLIPPGPDSLVYPNGYGFQAIAAFLAEISGLSITEFQVIGGSLLTIWLIFPGWLLYRELTNSVSGATLATLILLVQPEFLFAVLRGSHEKFSRGLMLFCLYLLVRSIRSIHRPRRFGALIIAFYLSAYALITLNNFISTSFIVAVVLALLLTLFFGRLEQQTFQFSRRTLNRLLYAAFGSLILAFLFIFYLYPPALHVLRLMESVWDQLALLFLDVENTVTAESYEAIRFGWINLPVYLVLTTANWLILIISAAIWLSYSWRWLRNKWRPQRVNELVLWAFYGSFAIIGFVSVLVDISGAVIGNLQHRTFPTFAMLAAPLISWAWLKRHSSRPKELGRSQPLVWLAIACLAILATLKATNEPLLSNKWTFYDNSESVAIDWADSALEERSLWVSYDERLRVSQQIQRAGQEPFRVQFDVYEVSESTRDFLISGIVRRRSLRLDQPLPVEADSLIIYDNGGAHVYHLRPRTPFQR